MVKIISTKIIGAMVSLVIIVMLIYSGPASAIEANISGLDNTKVKQGTDIEFYGRLNMDNLDRDAINVTLLIKQGNALVRECVFDQEGNPISGCDGILISLSSSTWNGYGYGNGQIDYQFTVDTGVLKTGAFDVSLIAVNNEGTIKSESERFVVQAKNNGKKGQDAPGD